MAVNAKQADRKNRTKHAAEYSNALRIQPEPGISSETHRYLCELEGEGRPCRLTIETEIDSITKFSVDSSCTPIIRRVQSEFEWNFRGTLNNRALHTHVLRAECCCSLIETAVNGFRIFIECSVIRAEQPIVSIAKALKIKGARSDRAMESAIAEAVRL